MLGLIGKKIGMTQIFDENGKVIPVTVVKAGPCQVVCKRDKAEVGYDAVQLGYEEVIEKKVTQPLRGHFKKYNSKNYRYLREFRPSLNQNIDDLNSGDTITVDLFKVDDIISVSGVSKGSGFSGVVKRWGFAGFESSHGAHESFRGPGSIGQCAQPSRVFKGLKMAGQHGNKRCTVRHLKVVRIDVENGLMMIKGAVPGHRNSLVLIHKES